MSEALEEKMTGESFAVRRESPLYYVIDTEVSPGESKDTEGCGVVLREVQAKGYLILRGNSSEASFTDGVLAALDVSLPTQAGTCLKSDDISIYWLSPDEWMLTVPGGTEADVQTRLRENLTGHFSVVDVSGGQTSIHLSGDDVHGVLKKSSGYDFDELVFGVGRCTQTTMAKATALVSKRADGSFDLIIRRSFADYIFSWIADAAGEYGFKALREV